MIFIWHSCHPIAPIICVTVCSISSRGLDGVPGAPETYTSTSVESGMTNYQESVTHKSKITVLLHVA